MDNAKILESLGTQTMPISEFHALLGTRMNPTAKANYVKQLELQGLVKVVWTRNEQGKLKASVTRA